MSGIAATNGHTWTPVLSILALVAGVSAVITPMYAGLINEHDQREKMELRVAVNAAALSEIRSELSAIKVQFAEVETQFKGAKEQLTGVSQLIDTRLLILDKTLQGEIKAQHDSTEIVRLNQKDNIAAVQELKVRAAQIETYLKTKALDGKAMP